MDRDINFPIPKLSDTADIPNLITKIATTINNSFAQKPQITKITLKANKWIENKENNNYTQEIEVSGFTGSEIIHVTPSDLSNNDFRSKIRGYGLNCTKQDGNILTFTVDNDKPMIDISITIIKIGDIKDANT